MPCSWCGSHRAVKQVLVNGQPQPSPLPGVPLHLCWLCWGTYRETGKRQGIGNRPPDAGPITGLPMTAERWRSLL